MAGRLDNRAQIRPQHHVRRQPRRQSMQHHLGDSALSLWRSLASLKSKSYRTNRKGILFSPLGKKRKEKKQEKHIQTQTEKYRALLRLNLIRKYWWDVTPQHGCVMTWLNTDTNVRNRDHVRSRGSFLCGWFKSRPLWAMVSPCVKQGGWKHWVPNHDPSEPLFPHLWHFSFLGGWRLNVLTGKCFQEHLACCNHNNYYCCDNWHLLKNALCRALL